MDCSLRSSKYWNFIELNYISDYFTSCRNQFRATYHIVISETELLMKSPVICFQIFRIVLLNRFIQICWSSWPLPEITHQTCQQSVDQFHIYWRIGNWYVVVVSHTCIHVGNDRGLLHDERTLYLLVYPTALHKKLRNMCLVLCNNVMNFLWRLNRVTDIKIVFMVPLGAFILFSICLMTTLLSVVWKCTIHLTRQIFNTNMSALQPAVQRFLSQVEMSWLDTILIVVWSERNVYHCMCKREKFLRFLILNSAHVLKNLIIIL